MDGHKYHKCGGKMCSERHDTHHTIMMIIIIMMITIMMIMMMITE